jgi:phospholipid/cholesterol/gamma-HCH transport system substrate-binding protein
MSTRRREIQVGLTVIAALLVLLAGVSWLKEWSLGRETRTWLVSFPQAGGLSPSDEVQVNGLRKGSVGDIRLAPQGVVIELEMTKDIALTDQCVVAIRNVGVMGEKVIGIELRPGGREYAAGDTIPGTYEMGIQEAVAQMGGALGSVERITASLEGVSAALDKDGDFSRTMKNLSEASGELRAMVKENRQALKGTVENFASASRTARALTTDRETQLRAALDDFAGAADKMDRLAGRMDSLRASVQRVSGSIERGEGTLGMLVQDDSLYLETRQSVREFKELVRDIRANPKKYINLKVF